MLDYRYVIIGGSMTADAAVRGIRKHDPSSSIGMISAEPYPPYNRPPLTKALWKGKPVDTIWRGTEKRQVDLFLERRIQELKPGSRQVVDDRGDTYHYEKLLVATGGKPRRLSFGGSDILYYRTLSNYYQLRKEADNLSSFAVIGGGFIGSEISAALCINHKDVTLILRDQGISAKEFPKDLSDFLNDYYSQKGVHLMLGTSVIGAGKSGEHIKIETDHSGTVEADAVVAGIGIQPNIDLAQQAGIEVGDGILVNELLQTTGFPEIYAAGDVASFYNPALGKRMRVEHEDNANTMGDMAGQNMAGQSLRYHHLPYFYSDLFDLGYEAVGLLDSRLKVTADWQEPYQKGVLYYQDGDLVRGVLLWNVWGKVDAARELIQTGEKIKPDSLIGKIPVS